MGVASGSHLSLRTVNLFMRGEFCPLAQREVKTLNSYFFRLALRRTAHAWVLAECIRCRNLLLTACSIGRFKCFHPSPVVPLFSLSRFLLFFSSLFSFCPFVSASWVFSPGRPRRVWSVVPWSEMKPETTCTRSDA